MSLSRSEPVADRPIGSYPAAAAALLRPELIRSIESRLVPEFRFAPAVAALALGGRPVAGFHLNQARAWDARSTGGLFTHRIAGRPDPIGVTRVRVVATEGSTIGVIGLGALAGSRVLDGIPSQPVFDAPPVALPTGRP